MACHHKIPTLEANVAKCVMDGWKDRQKRNVALASPYHEGKPCSKFDYIPPSGLGGDNVTDGLTDSDLLSPSEGHMGQSEN